MLAEYALLLVGTSARKQLCSGPVLGSVPFHGRIEQARDRYRHVSGHHLRAYPRLCLQLSDLHLAVGCHSTSLTCEQSVLF